VFPPPKTLSCYTLLADPGPYTAGRLVLYSDLNALTAATPDGCPLGSDKVNGNECRKMWGCSTIEPSDVPDLHVCKPEYGAIIGVFVSEMYFIPQNGTA